MPASGSQVLLCDLPIRFDTYIGCAHGCAYCFAQRKQDMATISPGESVTSLRRFIKGGRTTETSWCDWDIPLHWGGMSDPFQPIEAERKKSLECLKVFAETGYPFVFSTKGALVATPEYLALLRRCNVVGQVSMVSPQYDRLEPGAPPYADRLTMLGKLAPVVKRLIVRVQPYALGLVDDVLRSLPLYGESGVYGIVIEGMKRARGAVGMVRVGGDWCYPAEPLQRDFERIRDACHANDLAFFAGENRLRRMGDDPCCCGVTGVPGFVPNVANLNHLSVNGEIIYTELMGEPNTGKVFKALCQSRVSTEWLFRRRASYVAAMELAKRTKPFLQMMGYHLPVYDRD